MVKAKISLGQKKSLENISKYKIDRKKLIAYNPTKNLLDENFIGKAILECLKNNDSEGVIEVISIYLNTVNKVRASNKVSLPLSTLYHTLKRKNPTIKTLAKLVHSSTLDHKNK